MKSFFKVIRILIIIICLVVMAISGWYLFQYYSASKQNEAEYREAAEEFVIQPEVSNREMPVKITAEEVKKELPTIDFDALLEKSEFVRGWIQIPALDVVDYPVMANGDNDFYLHHTWLGEYSAHGSIFVEAVNTPDLSDYYNIIYGHNMKDGSMFGSLKKYREQSFYDEHGGVVMLYLPEETRIYEIFSLFDCNNDDTSVYSVGFLPGEAYLSFLQNIEKRSIIQTEYSVTENDNVIALSTCTNAGKDRLVVFAKMVECIPAE